MKRRCGLLLGTGEQFAWRQGDPVQRGQVICLAALDRITLLPTAVACSNGECTGTLAAMVSGPPYGQLSLNMDLSISQSPENDACYLATGTESGQFLGEFCPILPSAYALRGRSILLHNSTALQPQWMLPPADSWCTAPITQLGLFLLQV